MAGYSVSFHRNYRHAKEASKNFKIFINEGEMSQIKKWTLKKDNIETGGDLFGLWIDKHTAVVQFVLGPGQYCKRTPVSFFQDTEYLESAGTFLTKNHGLCNIGQWHSHHRLSLNKPSGGDNNTVWRNMPNLRLDRYIVFIANIASINEASVNCFLFEIQNGERLPVLQGNFNELAGNSPFRDDKEVLRSVLQGQELSNYGERCSNKTDDIENESKPKGTKLAKADGGQLVMTTASELPEKALITPVTYVKKNQTAPSKQKQTTPSRQQQTTPLRQQQTTPLRQQQTTPSQQQQTTPSQQQQTTPLRQQQTTPSRQQQTTLSRQYTSSSYNRGIKPKVQLTSFATIDGAKITDQTVPQKTSEISKKRLSSYDNCKEGDTIEKPPTEIPPQTPSRNTPPVETLEAQAQEPNEKAEGKRGCCSCYCCIS